MKSSGTKSRKSEAELLDYATSNLLRAIKSDMLKKDGRVNYDKLRKDGYSERFLNKFKQVV